MGFRIDRHSASFYGYSKQLCELILDIHFNQNFQIRMSKPSQWKRQNASSGMDFNMLNEHGRKINAQVQRLQRDRDSLIQQRTETSSKAVGRSNYRYEWERFSRQNPSSYDNANRQHGGNDRYGARGVPETIPEESSRRYKQTEAVERVENVKGLIDQLVQDSKIQNQEVKNRLRNIQQKQQQLLNDMENYSPKISDNRPTGLYEPRPLRYTVTHEDERPRSEYQSSSRPTGGQIKKTYKYKQEVAEFGLQPMTTSEAYNVEGSSDPLSGLNALEGRIVEEIMSLRERNIRLMKNLNAETKNFNELLTDYKKLEEQNSKFKENLAITANQLKVKNSQLLNDYKKLENENAKLKEHLATIADELNSIKFSGRGGQRHAEARGERVGSFPTYNPNGSEYGENQSEENRFLTRELEKLQKENQILREKARKKSTFGSRHSAAGEAQFPDLRDENAKLKQALRAARADADRLEQELNQRERTQAGYGDDERVGRQSQTISDLKDQLSQAQQDISRLRAENKRLEGSGRGGAELQGQLDDLKLENDRLRKETIDLLRQNAGSTRNRDNDRYKVSQGLSYNSYSLY